MRRRTSLLEGKLVAIVLFTGGWLLAALAGCKAHVAVVKPASSDRDPPYNIVDESSPLARLHSQSTD